MLVAGSNVNVSNKVTRLRKYEGNFNIISKFTPDQVRLLIFIQSNLL